MTDSTAHPSKSPILLASMPEKIGPFIGTIIDRIPENWSENDRVRRAHIGINDDLLFSVSQHGDTAPDADATEGTRILVVPPLEELGSEALARAQDSLPDILEALASDVALLPVRVDDAGELRPVAFTDESTGDTDLHIYSSAASFFADKGGTDGLFVIRHGAALIDFAMNNTHILRRIVIDPQPANEYPTTIDLPLLAELLALSASDDEEEFGDDLEEAPPVAPTDLDLNLPSHWATIDLLLPEEERKDAIRRLVKKQTQRLSDAGAKLRLELRTWLERTAANATSKGGRQFSFLVARTQQAAAALNLVLYWHDLNAGAPTPAFELVERELRESAEANDDLVLVESDGDRLLRRARMRRGSRELGGDDIPLLIVDYWIEVPHDARHLAHIVFSTPHVFARTEILELCDAIALGCTWIVDDE